MPHKALIACGIVLSSLLLGLTGPAWCSAINSSTDARGRSINTAAHGIAQQTVQKTSSLPALTLAEVLTRAAQQSPKLSVFSHELKAREFEARQAGLRPNPELSIALENAAGSGVFSGTDNAEITLRVSQLFELGGKRIRRQELGRIGQELAEQEYAIARSEVIAEASQRFIAVLAAQKRLLLATEQIELTQLVLQAVEDRIAAGKAAPLEKIRFQTLVAEARLRQSQVRQELTAARQILATSWSSDEPDFGAVQGQLERVQPAPSWADLATRLGQSPQLALRQTIFNGADRGLALERARRIPDLRLSLGARNDQNSGDNSLVAEVSMPLQIFNRNQHGIAAADARMAKAQDEARSAQLQLRAELAEGWRELQAAHGEVAALRDSIIPATQQAFDAVTYGYQSGKFGFLEVLDAERTLFAAKSRYVDALKTYHQALLELELLLGQKILPRQNPAASDTNQRGQS